MAQQTPAEVQKSTQRLMPRGRPFPKGVSGNPSGKTLGKRYMALFADLASDLGGEEALTGIERALLGQAVGLMVRAERVRNTDDAVRLANASARLLASLRKGHKAREPAGLGALLAQGHERQRRERED